MTPATNQQTDWIVQALPLLQEGVWKYEPYTGLMQCSAQMLGLLGLPPEPQAIPLSIVLAKTTPEKRDLLRTWLTDLRAEGRAQTIRASIQVPGLGAPLFTWKGRIIREEADEPPFLVGTLCPALDFGPIAGLAHTASPSEQDISAAAFVQKLPVAAWITEASGNLIYANPRFYTWINKQSDETGTPIYHHIPASLADSYRAATEKVVAENTRIETYVPAARPDGKLAYLLVHLFPVKQADGTVNIGGAAFDMSEVRMAAARESFENADKEALINSTTDIMWSYDRDLNFITGNNTFKTSFFNRYQVEIERGQSIFNTEMLAPEEYTYWGDRYRETLLGRSIQEELYQQEEDRWIQLTFNPIYQNDAVIGGTCLAKTITAQKKAELERKALIEELQLSNDDMRQFTYMVSHDLRTPVRNLQMVASMLKDEWLAEGEARDLMKILRDTSTRLSETLQNQIELMMVKDHKKVVVEELEFEAIYKKIYSSIEQLILAADARIVVHFSEAPKVHFSGLYLESIFLNLLSNSLKYARPGVPPRIDVWSQQTPTGPQLSIRDNGKGFDMEKVKGRLFGLNQRFHGNFDSSGVGLYIVQSQVTALGGSIKAEAKENEGATFTITFPGNMGTHGS